MYEEQRYQHDRLLGYIGPRTVARDFDLDPPDDPAEAAVDSIEEEVRAAVQDDDAFLEAFCEVVDELAEDKHSGPRQLVRMLRNVFSEREFSAVRKAMLRQLLDSITSKHEADENNKLSAQEWNQVRAWIRYQIERGILL